MPNKPAPVTEAEHLCLDTVLSLHEELARYRERITAAEQERDDYKEATADVLTWMRSWLDAARESHEGAKPEDKAFWVSGADNRRTAIRQVQNIEARQSPRRIRALLEVPDEDHD